MTMNGYDIPDGVLRHFSIGGIVPDREQRAVAARLSILLSSVTNGGDAGRSRGTGRGVFLWGDVGRGKSSLVDAVVAAAPSGVARRWHQLAFLDAFHRVFAGAARHDFPAAIDALIGNARLLAFDEFHVHDIADAQILQRAFSHLAARGVRLIVTANPPPAALAGAADKQRHFAPLIEFLDKWCESIELVGDVDYRRAGISGCLRWLVPDSATTRQRGLAQLNTLSTHVVAADFEAWCRMPRCHADYASLVEPGMALAIWSMPCFGPRDGDALRRLVWLADVLWERQVPLAVTAATTAEEVFTRIGEALRGLLGRDLARAESRLIALCGLSVERLKAASASP